MLAPGDLPKLFGNIDIYVFDQLQRGNLVAGQRVLDLGCGGGRNLCYLMQAGFEVMGLDPDPRAISATREMASRLAPHLPTDAFRAETAEESTFADGCADVVICNAVLHFVRDHQQFDAVVDGAWRLLAPGGLFFARLASTIRIEGRVQDLGKGRFRRPDGAELYLVDTRRLLDTTDRLGGRLLDPIKTTNVQDLRCMTTWVVRKPT